MADLPVLSNIKKLTLEDFTACGSLTRSDLKTKNFVLFYSSLCGHCKSFANIYADFNKQYGGEVGVFCMNINSSNNNIISMSQAGFPYNIKMYPTLTLYSNENPCSVYEGTRSVAALNNYITSQPSCFISTCNT